MAMAAISPLHLVFFFCLLVFSESIRDNHLRNFGGVEFEDEGFTTTFFHRDSLLSPFYDSSLSRYERFNAAVRRSISRSTILAKRLSTSSSAAVSPANSIHSPITHGGGDFYMHVSIGTPPVEYVAIADTGSDLTWTQCLPCKNCFNQSNPIFNPRRSSSYSIVPCSSDYCRNLDRSFCGSSQMCDYMYKYGDLSYTNGELGFEKIEFASSKGNNFVVEGIVIGCGHDNGGTFKSLGSGIIGLGAGELSLVSQLNKISQISRKFSYCLPANQNLTTNINFGNLAVVTGPTVVKTPIVPKDRTFYFITLEAITIGNKRLQFKTDVTVTAIEEAGNIIIDSGTTFTFLPQPFFDDIVSAFEGVIKAKRVDDPTGNLKLCYAKNESSLNIPAMTVHFTGASVQLSPFSTFGMVSENVICLTFLPSSGVPIYGNLAQINFLIGYDLDNRMLSFMPTTCR